MVLKEICRLSDKSLQQDRMLTVWYIISTLDMLIFSHVGCYFPTWYVREIDMLHGSTIMGTYFFNLSRILTIMMIVSSCARLTTFRRK